MTYFNNLRKQKSRLLLWSNRYIATVSNVVGRRGTEMADVEIVIKIPEELYKRITVEKEYFLEDGEDLCTAVENGKPLPERHGRLIDAKVAYKKFYCRSMAKLAKEVLDETPTILEKENNNANSN